MLPKNKTLIAKVPKGEEIVATTTFGGYYRWDSKFPFKHYVQPRYLFATKNAIYQLEIKHTNLGDEIFTMKKPDTSWHSTLVGVVAMIAVMFILCGAIYLGFLNGIGYI